MAFTPIQYDDGKVVDLPFDDAEVVTKFCAVVANTTTGYYATGAAGANDVRYIALEGKTVSEDGETVKCLPVKNIRFIADTSAAPTRNTSVGTFVDLASSTTLLLGTSVDDVFYVEDIYGPTANKKVTGYFMSQVAGA